jgi:hypothetical protein
MTPTQVAQLLPDDLLEHAGFPALLWWLKDHDLWLGLHDLDAERSRRGIAA